MVVTYSVPDRHNASVGDMYIWSRPYSIDLICASEPRGSYLFLTVVPNDLSRVQVGWVGKGFPNFSFVNILVCVQANYEAPPLLLLFLELVDEILKESIPWT